MLGQNPIRKQERDPTKLQIVGKPWFTLQGEGPFSGQCAVFIRLTGCNLACTFCLAGHTRILMADWSLKQLKDIKMGDMVMGSTTASPFPSDRHTGLDYSARHTIKGQHSRLVPTRVTAIHSNGIKSVARMKADGRSLVGTPDHRVFIRTYRSYWQQLINTSGQTIKTIRIEETESKQFRDGWLAGYLQGDGCFHEFKPKIKKKSYLRLKVASRDEELLTETHTLLLESGYVARRIIHGKGKNTQTNFHSKLGAAIGAVEITKSADARHLYERVMQEPRANYDYARGWLSGFYDAEGSYSTDGSPRLSQGKPGPRQRLKEVLDYLGLRYSSRISNQGVNYPMHTFAITNTADFFAMCRPVLKRKMPPASRLSIRHLRSTTVDSVENLDLQIPVYDITTEAHNYVAEGFIVHNCDTEWSDTKDLYRPVADIVAEATIVQPRHCKIAVITGGEPLRQNLSKLIEGLRSAFPIVQIETAGTLWQPCLDQEGVFIVVSPKTPKIDRHIYEHAKVFKYVVKANELGEDGLPVYSTQRTGQRAHLARPRPDTPVYLSPCDENHWELNALNRKAVTTSAQAHGYIAGVQLHKILGVD